MTFNIKKLSMFVAAIAALAIMAPGLAFAHGGGDSGKDRGGRDDDRDGRKVEFRNNFSSVNEFGVRVFDKNSNGDNDRGVKRGHDLQLMPGLFYSGTVTAVSSSSFTMETKGNGSLTVNTGSAKLIRIPRSVITTSDIEVGDKVFVTGTKSGSTVTASVVYDKPANLKPALAKGTVTATSGTTLTVQNKNGSEATVETDSDTQITNKDGDTLTLADLAIGAKVKIFGLWDGTVNILNALRIAIK